MAPFRGERLIIVADPMETGFSQAGSRRDQAGVSVGLGLSRMKQDQIVLRQGGNAMSIGFQIIDQFNEVQAQQIRQFSGVNDPGKIRRLAHPVLDGSGDADAGRGYRLRILLQEFVHDLFQAPILPAWKELNGDLFGPIPLEFKNP